MMTIRRRCAERSTTTSVSDEWIEVSRFIVPCPNAPFAQPHRWLRQLYYTNKSPRATERSRLPPLLFDEEWHLFGKRALLHLT